MQRLTTPDESQWRARIIANRTIISASQSSGSGIRLKIAESNERKRYGEDEELEVDYVFTATGYRRNAHEGLLSEVKELLGDEGKWDVQRDYRVRFREGAVDEGAGIWLQGCNEKTHGVSFLFPYVHWQLHVKVVGCVLIR